jgi:hypothetical protein
LEGLRLLRVVVMLIWRGRYWLLRLQLRLGLLALWLLLLLMRRRGGRIVSRRSDPLRHLLRLSLSHKRRMIRHHCLRLRLPIIRRRRPPLLEMDLGWRSAGEILIDVSRVLLLLLGRGSGCWRGVFGAIGEGMLGMWWARFWLWLLLRVRLAMLLRLGMLWGLLLLWLRLRLQPVCTRCPKSLRLCDGRRSRRLLLLLWLLLLLLWLLLLLLLLYFPPLH